MKKRDEKRRKRKNGCETKQRKRKIALAVLSAVFFQQHSTVCILSQYFHSCFSKRVISVESFNDTENSSG